MTFGPGDDEPSPSLGREATHVAPSAQPQRVTFDRHELDRILNLYGRKVAAGEWRDYAIDFLKDRAVFSIFRRSSEVPLYRIEKDPRLSRRQGAYRHRADPQARARTRPRAAGPGQVAAAGRRLIAARQSQIGIPT
jgi:hypothetical protein